MKNIAVFLLREMPSYAKEIQNNLKQLYSSLDSTQLEIEKKLPSFRGNYTKIGEYYSMAQELNEIKKQVQEVKKLFIIEDQSEKTTSFTELSAEVNEEINSDKDDYKKNLAEESNRINYNDYRIDDTIPYTLSEDFTYKRPAAFEFNSERYIVKDWKQMLLMFCEIMYNKNHSMFHGIVMGQDMQGKTRAYFSDTECTYKPMVDGRKIAGSNIYVETNHSANTICCIIKSLLRKYNTPIETVKVYLKADYSPLHQAELKMKKEKNNVQSQTPNEVDIKTDCQCNNPDDYRFIKDSYIKKSDPLMEGLSQRMGTPSHIEYLHMEENDMRRHKSRCIEYDKKKDVCMCTKSANFLLKCGGSSHCEYYKEESNQTSDYINVTVNKPLIRLKPEIIVIDKKKIKQCPSCKCATRKEWLTVTYNNNGEYIKNQLTSYHCDRCQSSYIADTLFRTYTSHKNIDKIDVMFIQK